MVLHVQDKHSSLTWEDSKPAELSRVTEDGDIIFLALQVEIWCRCLASHQSSQKHH